MFAYAFIQNAFIAAGIVAVMAGFLGYFLVLRGQAFAGHALGHAGFAGAAGAALIGYSPLSGLVCLTVFAGLLMGFWGEKLRERDVTVGIILAFSLGLGILFLHFYTGYAGMAMALLFGDVFALAPYTVIWLAVGAVIALGGLFLIVGPLLFSTLRPEAAAAKGVPVRLVSVIFLMLAAVGVAGSIEIVGVLLVFSLMTGPAAAAHKLTPSFKAGVILAVLLALIEAWGGIVLAYYTNWPVSFWVTALSALFYILASLPLLKQKRLFPG